LILTRESKNNVVVYKSLQEDALLLYFGEKLNKGEK
jgi:hypothetical protein